MVSKFSCKNFRNINIEDIELKKINILIGPNNSGKSNFIKALTFYSNMLKHAIEGNEETDFLNAIARNGWNHSKNYNAEGGEPISFEWNLTLDEEPVIFRFEYKTGERRNDFYISQEKLDSAKTSSRYTEKYNYFTAHLPSDMQKGIFSTSIKKGKDNKRLFFDVRNDMSICSQFKDILLKDADVYSSEVVRDNIAPLINRLETAFKSFFSYSSAKIDTARIRKAANAKGIDRFLLGDGSNFANLFNSYKNKGLGWKYFYLNNMKLLIKDLVDIDVTNPMEDLNVRLYEKGLEGDIDLSDVSEGTIKALVWNLLLVTPQEKNYELLAIDEPENNLHPAWQKVIADWIISSKAYKQCIISTHSPDFLDAFTEKMKTSDDIAVYVFGHNGYIKKIEYSDIAEDLGDWLLGDLYRTNDPALGGWPW